MKPEDTVAALKKCLDVFQQLADAGNYPKPLLGEGWRFLTDAIESAEKPTAPMKQPGWPEPSDDEVSAAILAFNAGTDLAGYHNGTANMRRAIQAFMRERAGITKDTRCDECSYSLSVHEACERAGSWHDFPGCCTSFRLSASAPTEADRVHDEAIEKAAKATEAHQTELHQRAEELSRTHNPECASMVHGMAEQMGHHVDRIRALKKDAANHSTMPASMISTSEGVKND